jgi:pimeloyl-ACP methyl ester carboxylesterase
VLSLAGVIDLEAAWNLHLSDDAVTGFLGGTPFEVFENYQSANPMHLPIKEAKQWVIHGTRDIDVPVALAQNYVAAKSNEKVQFICVPDADHYDLINPDSDPWQVVDGIIRESLLA